MPEGDGKQERRLQWAESMERGRGREVVWERIRSGVCLGQGRAGNAWTGTWELVGPQPPALKAGRKDERRECGGSHLQVKGGFLEEESKGEGFTVDFAHNKRSTICPRQPSPGGLKGNPQTSASSQDQLCIQPGDFSKVPET